MNKIIGFEFNNEKFTPSTENEITNILTFRDNDLIVVICDSEKTIHSIVWELNQMNDDYEQLLYSTEDDKNVLIDDMLLEPYAVIVEFNNGQNLILSVDKEDGFSRISNPEELWFASKNNQNTITIYAYTDFIDYKKYWDEGKTLIMLKEGRFI